MPYEIIKTLKTVKIFLTFYFFCLFFVIFLQFEVDLEFLTVENKCLSNCGGCERHHPPQLTKLLSRLKVQERVSLFSYLRSFADGVNLGDLAPLSVGDEALSGAICEDLLDGLGDIGEMGLDGESEGLIVLTSGIQTGKNTIYVDIQASDFYYLEDRSGEHIINSEGLFVLLVCEDVLGSDYDLGGSVLAGLNR